MSQTTTHTRKSVTTRDVVTVALAAALSVALSFLRLIELPQGGSITLELLPVFYIAFLRGPWHGVAAGLVSGTIQLILRPFIVHPAQVLLDYPIAMAVAGVAGFLRGLDSDRAVRTGLGAIFGIILVAIGVTGWVQLDRIGNADRVVLSRDGDWSTVVEFAPDTALGDVQARMLTLRERGDGVTDTLTAITSHGDKARVWLTQAVDRLRTEYTRWFGGIAVLLVMTGGIAVIARYLSVGTVALGVLIGGALVFTAHFFAGVVFFAQYAPAGSSVWVYSAIYNASYVTPQIVLSLIILPPLLRRAQRH